MSQMDQPTYIDTYHGQRILVDPEDYERMAAIRWYTNRYGYASTHGVYMHRLIMSAPSGFHVDHINHDLSDNRKSNLRICSHRENLSNVKLRADNTSGYKGVSYEKSIGRYRAYVNHRGKRYNLKTYKTAREGALAYNAKALELFGEYAFLNEIL